MSIPGSRYAWMRAASCAASGLSFCRTTASSLPGDSATEIRATYRRVLEALHAEYRKAGISTKLQRADVPNMPEPVTPDHIVYGLSAAKNPRLAAEMALDSALIRQLADAFGGVQLLESVRANSLRTGKWKSTGRSR